MAEHATLTGSQLHEPKGVAAATANKVYVSNGSASGAWTKIPAAVIDTTSIFNLNKYAVTVQMTDVSTADFILVPCPNACTLTKATLILQGAITVANSTVTLVNSAGSGTLATQVVATIGSAEGVRYTITPSANQDFTAGTYLKIATDGASSTVCKAVFFLEFTRTA